MPLRRVLRHVQCLPVFAASLDRTVRLWDLNTDETLCQFHPDLGALNTAVFGPDESTILTGGQHNSFAMLDSHDAIVRLWPVPSAATE